jgi:hypothetical protein
LFWRDLLIALYLVKRILETKFSIAREDFVEQEPGDPAVGKGATCEIWPQEAVAIPALKGMTGAAPGVRRMAQNRRLNTS